MTITSLLFGKCGLRAFKIFMILIAVISSTQLLLAQTPYQNLDKESKELLLALEGRHPTMSRSDARKQFDQMEELPKEIAMVLIVNLNSRDGRTRIPPRILLRKVKFDVELAEAFFDSLARPGGYHTDGYMVSPGRINGWSKWVTQPGDKVIPLLRRKVMNKKNNVVLRDLAISALAKFDRLPDDVLVDLEKLLAYSSSGYGGTKSGKKAAIILAKHGPKWVKRLEDLMDSENDWIRTHAAGTLEITFPRQYPKANEVLLEVAQSGGKPHRVAFSFLGETGGHNALKILQMGRKLPAAFGAISQLYSEKSNRKQINRDCLPLLKTWMRDEGLRALAFDGYRSIARNNPEAMRDLCDMLSTADRRLAYSIVNLVKLYGGEIGVEAAAPLVLKPETQEFALSILKYGKFDGKYISPKILDVLIELEKTQQKYERFGYRSELIRLLYQASGLTEESTDRILRLEQLSPIQHGHTMNWLAKTEGERAKKIFAELRKWNEQALVADFSGNFYSEEPRPPRKRVKRATYSPDGERFAFIEKDQLRILNRRSKKLVQSISLPRQIHQWYRPEFNRSGKQIAAIHGDFSSFCIWDVDSGELLSSSYNSGLKFLSDPLHLLKLQNVGQVSTFQFADATRFAVHNEFSFERAYPDIEEKGGILAVWDSSGVNQSSRKTDLEIRKVPSGELLQKSAYPEYRMVDSRRYWMSGPRLSPKGQFILLRYSGLRNNTGGYLEIRNSHNLDLVAKLDWWDYAADISIPQFDSDEETLVISTSDGKAHFWKFKQSDKPKTKYVGTYGNPRLINDRWLLYPGVNAVLVDTSRATEPVSFWMGNSVRDVSSLGDGKFLEVASLDGIRLFDCSLLPKYCSPTKLTGINK